VMYKSDWTDPDLFYNGQPASLVLGQQEFASKVQLVESQKSELPCVLAADSYLRYYIYAIKKVMKIAAVVVGLFVAVAFLSYKDWIDVRWTEVENATRSAKFTSHARMRSLIYCSTFRSLLFPR
jgi:FUN14 family